MTSYHLKDYSSVFDSIGWDYVKTGVWGALYRCNFSSPFRAFGEGAVMEKEWNAKFGGGKSLI